MSLSPKLGKLLKEAREARKLTIRDVNEGTKISMRFIEAIEAENYTIFPAETYLVGFLTQYARFLNLNVDEILEIYRNDKMDASEAPIKELIQKLKWYQLLYFHLKKYWFHGLALIILVFLFASGIRFYLEKGLPNFFSFLSEDAAESSSYCHSGERQVNAIALPTSSSPPRDETLSLNPPDALRFSLDQLYFKLCIFEIKKDVRKNKKISVLHLNVNDKENIRFELSERQTYVLERKPGILQGLEHRIKLTPIVIGDFSIRLEMETEDIFVDQKKLADGNESEGSGTDWQRGNDAGSHEAAGINIQVTLRFTEDSYIEWVQDGQSHAGRIIVAGEVRTFEARDRLDLKVGNGRGVTRYREGARPRVLGPAGHIVHLNYTRIPDPLDPSVYRIREDISVVR